MHVYGCDPVADQSTSIDHLQPGGKARNLIELSRQGFRVPPFFVLPASAFRYVVARNPELQSLIGDLARAGDSQRSAAADQLRNAIASCQWPEQLHVDFAEAFNRMMDLPGQNGLSQAAIRSSAVDEDSEDHSFAGMHDSFLFVNGFEEAIEKSKRVWGSAFNDRAISYRLESGLSIAEIAIGVVIQRMIDPSVSGVVFTCNPANGRTDEMVVSSLFGVGEGLVSAGFAADTFTLNKRTRGIQSDIVDKTRQIVLDSTAGEGVREQLVADDLQKSASLDEEQLNTTALTAIEIENTFRRPQDIEFCFDKSSELFVLQARPVTRQNEFGPAAGNRLVWDNSNIIESYSGVTTPMTFSFIRRAYTIVYHCFAEVMGISPRKVKDSRLVFENMLGLIRGRVYYNLQNWYRLIRLFPGFQYNASFMESMMGLKEPLVLDDPVPKPGFWRKWFVEFPALVRLVLRTGWNFLRIKSIVRDFEDNFREHYDRWDAMDFLELAPHELRELYHEMEDALLWNWKAPIINDFYVMIYYGLLKKLCKGWCGDETGTLQNDLICGEGGVESAEPAKMLLRLASVAGQNTELRDEICNAPLEELPARISSNGNYRDFNILMTEYLDRYGFR
ncbi:MAG: PEP/pyruvate-binding domain-containing protein, partial [Pirellulaceae bacterium]